LAAVTLLAAGAKANSGTSTPLDVSAYTSLRLDASVQAYPTVSTGGMGAYLQLWLETAALVNGPWSQLYYCRIRQCFAQGQHPEAWPANNVQRIVANGFDNFVRARWFGAPDTESNGVPTSSTAGFQLGVAGVAQ
jgi:hypothetical protein